MRQTDYREQQHLPLSIFSISSGGSDRLFVKMIQDVSHIIIYDEEIFLTPPFLASLERAGLGRSSMEAL